MAPAIANCGCINLAAGQISHSHRFKLIDVIDRSGDDIIVIPANGLHDKRLAVMCLEVANDSSIKQLNIRCQVGSEILDVNICEIRGNAGTEIVLKQHDALASPA